jgi:hypothetical protein
VESEADLDKIYRFYQEVCKHLGRVVPFRKTTSGTIDIETWLGDVDAQCQIHELRSYVLAHAPDVETLGVLLRHLVGKRAQSAEDQPKIDLLLVHYLVQSTAQRTDLNLLESSQLLQPVLGVTTPKSFPALRELELELRDVDTLQDLLGRKLIDRVSKAKADHHDHSPAANVVFAWLGLMLRRACVRAVTSDIRSIERDLAQLKLHGITHLDSGVMGRQETDVLLQRCYGWSRPFPGKYQDDSWFREIANVRGMTRVAALWSVGDSGIGPAPAPMTGDSAASPPRNERPAANSAGKAAAHDTPGEAVPVLKTHLDGIAMQLKNIRSKDFARVEVGKAAIMLSASEIQAFRSPGEQSASLLKDIVGARALLAVAKQNKDSASRTEAHQFAAAVLAKARAAVAALQKQPAQQELAIHLRASLRGLEKAISQ